MENIQKNAGKNKLEQYDLQDDRLQFAEGIDRCARDGNDIAEADALTEQTDFAAILLLIGIVGLPIGCGTAHLDSFPAALGDVLVSAARHPFRDGQPLHRSDFKQDGADKGCDGIDLAVGVESLKVVILHIETDPMLVEALYDLEGLEGVTTETADFKTDHLVNVVGFHIID